ncbi:hypothetical protein T09_7791 [Trichinella sp. T9]|nr:hypothetical protein T09_7791 [Trichinella sp. T9]
MEWLNLIVLMGDALRDCQNGGSKTFNLKCSCPKLFTGNYCQHIKCVNGGIKRPNETCICPDAKHYTGRHCETLMCENGGIANEFGSCNCSSAWYTGQFCEYSVWWSLFYGIIVLIIVFVTFVFICWLRKFCRSKRNTQIGNVTAGRQGNLECQLSGGQSEMSFLSRASRYKQRRGTSSQHRPEPLFTASHGHRHQQQSVEKPSSDYPEAPPPPYEAALFMKKYVCNLNDSSQVLASLSTLPGKFSTSYLLMFDSLVHCNCIVIYLHTMFYFKRFYALSFLCTAF